MRSYNIKCLNQLNPHARVNSRVRKPRMVKFVVNVLHRINAIPVVNVSFQVQTVVTYAAYLLN